MPEMDGFEAVRTIRAREADDRQASADPRADRPCHAGRSRAVPSAGFDGYLAKPIRQADLQTALEVARDREATARPDPIGSLLVGELMTICGGDEAFARELAESFLESAPRCLDRHRARPRSRGPHDLWPRRPMRLKGISRTIGAEDLAAPARHWRSLRQITEPPTVSGGRHPARRRAGKGTDRPRTALSLSGSRT